jgi:hypothetical protein
MIRSQLSAETYATIDEIVRVASRAVARAQEESRRLGVPNVYAINGRILYETLNGELSAADPFTRGADLRKELRGDSAT